MWLPITLLLVLAQQADAQAQDSVNVASSSFLSAHHQHQDDASRRQLQLQAGDTAQGGITKDYCKYKDSYTDPRLVCDLKAGFSSSSSSVDLDVVMNCASTSSTISDFRRLAEGCLCTAVVTDPVTQESKSCPCAACPEGGGDNSIFVDCGPDVTLIDSCSSIDCDYTCNGPNEVEILTAAPTVTRTPPPTPPPTSAPTPVGGGSGATSRHGCLSLLLLMLAVTAQSLSVVFE